MSDYATLLRDPRWQRKRLHVFQLAGFRCTRCGSADRELHAHHKHYLKGHKPWEYEDALLECLCSLCHDAAHADQEELDLLIGRQPTSALPMLTDAVAAAIDHGVQQPAALPPKAREALRRLAHALCGSDPQELVDAQNAMQDIVDEYRDFRRGPGGVWRTAA